MGANKDSKAGYDPPLTKRSSVTILIVAVTAAMVVVRIHELQEVVNQSHQVDAEKVTSWAPPAQRHQRLGGLSWDPLNPLGIPPGKAQNLPSVRVEDKAVDEKRKIYGGAGDKQHLGGFTSFDIEGVSPFVWKHMISEFGIKSLLDVGCGRGISTLFFLTHGVDVLCAEGSHDAVERTLLPDPEKHVVEHDFSRGPWWPEKTYDAVWSVEFLEHVSRQYHFNYMTAFREAAIVFVTSSRRGGWHHVEVHPDWWWVRKFESYGFRYDAGLSEQVKEWSQAESRNRSAIAPDGRGYTARHINKSMKVFINPVVAALPQHAHLFPRPGCHVSGSSTQDMITRECGTGPNGKMDTPLPTSFLPLTLTAEQDKAWEDVIRNDIAKTQAEEEKSKKSQ